MPQPDNKLRIPETLRNVKSIIGIFSAKGGVGKSAISLQLALALKEKGLKIGLVDADIYGPSQPVMLNSSPGELKLTKNEINAIIQSKSNFLSIDINEQIIQSDDCNYTFELSSFQKYLFLNDLSEFEYLRTKSSQICDYERNLNV